MSKAITLTGCSAVSFHLPAQLSAQQDMKLHMRIRVSGHTCVSGFYSEPQHLKKSTSVCPDLQIIGKHTLTVMIAFLLLFALKLFVKFMFQSKVH